MGRRGKKNTKTLNNETKTFYQPGKFVLNMIVKDEAHTAPEETTPIIQRCLDNVGHLIDAIAIVDTGSTDETVTLIEKWAEEHKVPCQVIPDPWTDCFDYHRNKALDHGADVVAKIKRKELKYSPEQPGDLWYYLFMDADNMAFANDGKSPIQINKNKLGADKYIIPMHSVNNIYDYFWILRIDPVKKWKWYQPRHEYICPEKNITGESTWQPKIVKLDSGYIHSRREGSRSQDPLKYLRDAIIFERYLLQHPMDDRALYYLAQSYRDAAKQFTEQAIVAKQKAETQDIAEKEKWAVTAEYQQLTQKATNTWKRAEKAYLFRASAPPFNNWNDEYTYCAWVQAGLIRNGRKGRYDLTSMEYFANAHQKRPHRLEAAFYILNYYLQKRAYRVGWEFAKDLVKTPYPTNEKIFVDDEIHRYNFIFEASLCAYYSDAKEDFITLSKLVLRNPSTPDNIKEAAKSNLDKFGK